MNQYLLIPFLMGWTSIYQLFWGSLGTRVLTHPHLSVPEWRVINVEQSTTSFSWSFVRYTQCISRMWVRNSRDPHILPLRLPKLWPIAIACRSMVCLQGLANRKVVHPRQGQRPMERVATPSISASRVASTGLGSGRFRWNSRVNLLILQEFWRSFTLHIILVVHEWPLYTSKYVLTPSKVGEYYVHNLEVKSLIKNHEHVSSQHVCSLTDFQALCLPNVQ